MSTRARERPELKQAVPRIAWAAAALAVAVFACIVYWGTLRNGFVYDDIPQVVKNPWIRDPRNLLRAFTMGSWAYEGTTSNYYRPVMHLVYTASYVLFGLAPAGFHAVSIALHAAVSVLVLASSAAVLRHDRRSPRDRVALATAAALLFASHPIHTEAVSWIGGVPDLCAALFCLASFCGYASLPTGRVFSWRYALSLFLFLLATLSKEIALVFPLVLVAYDLAFRRGKGNFRRRAGFYVGYALVGVAYLVLRWNALGGFAPVRRHPEITGSGVPLNAIALFAAYLRKLVLPVDLSVFYAFRPLLSWRDPSAITSLAVALLFAAAGAVLFVKRSAGASVAWVMVLVPLLPALYIPAVGENPFAERYLYLPSVGFVWLLVLAAGTLRISGARIVVPAFGVLLIAAYTVGTTARVKDWASDLSLWQDAVAKSPNAPIAHYNLGAALFAEGRADLAVSEFEAAVRIEPSPLAWTSLGNAYREAGRPEEGVRAFRAALSLDSNLEAAYDGLGLAYVELGQPAKALEPLRIAVALAPRSAIAHHSLGFAYERLGLFDAAIQGYEEALRIDPSDAAARQHLMKLLRGR
jgi:tetratricopeptide (TPR) repeat protein